MPSPNANGRHEAAPGGADASAGANSDASKAAPASAGDRIRALFADGGPLAEVIPGYRRRAEQETFALKASEALAGGRTLLADVPTGTGKSLAYLAAAVCSGRAVVSTATVALQAQLHLEDAPALARAMALMEGGSPEDAFTHGVIKGRSHYLCMRRHEDALRAGSLLDPKLLSRLDRFRTESETGDREDVPFAMSRNAWAEVASDPEDCQPKSCSFRHEGCFVYAARERASECDLIFVSHAMLLANANADGAIFGTEGKALIVDEAHALEGVMSEAFGARVSHGRVLHATRLARKRSDSAGPQADRAEAASDLFFDDLRRRGELGGEEAAPMAYRTLRDALRSTEEALGNDPKEEANALSPTVGRLREDLESFYSEPQGTHAYAVVAPRGEVGKFSAGRASARPELRSWLVDTDLAFAGEVAPLFSGGGMVLCSATLAEGGRPAPADGAGVRPAGAAKRSFSYVRKRLGLWGEDVAEHSGDEIFDYARRALVYVAGDLPAPAGAPGGGPGDHTEACVRRTEELVALSGGRALVLLSTNRAVGAFRRSFKVPYPVRYQGDDATGRLVRWLKESSEGAVLVGTRSFWTGISAPGAVRLVVVDRTPFVPPGDPVFEALKERAGSAWFSEVAMPKARVALRQGTGRLMRAETDSGVIAVLDPRIASKGWGKAILSALPPAPVTGELAEVAEFFGRTPTGRPS